MGGIDEQVRELLGPGGTLARRLPGYEHREGQLRFARAVSSALEQDGTLIGEAGTGIGKSFGYLVPAILLAEERGKPVVISTRTKALQEQLNAKDLPFLQAVLPMEFTWTVAVGRNNYVCMRRFERAKKDRGTLFRDESHYEQLEAIAQLTTGSGHGTRDELGFVPKSSLWDEVCAEQGNCLGRKCRYYTPCPWQKSRRRLHNAQLLVVNHALYFADLALREHDVSLLPEHAAVIFDEAHHLEDIAGQALGRQLSGGMFEWVLSRLLTRSGRRGLLARHDPGLWQPVLGDLRGHVELWFGQVGHLAGSEGEARHAAPGFTVRGFAVRAAALLRQRTDALGRARARARGAHGARFARAASRGARESRAELLLQRRRQRGSLDRAPPTAGRPLRSAGARRPSPRRAALGQGRPGQAPGLGHARPA
jgi:Rad3-related DNA helicase